MVANNRAVEAKASEIVALVESTPDTDPPLLDRPDFLSRFNLLEIALVNLIHDGQRHIWHTTALASHLDHKDRAVVESKVGKLFTETGALGTVWKENWLCGRQLSRAGAYRRMLRNR